MQSSFLISKCLHLQLFIMGVLYYVPIFYCTRKKVSNLRERQNLDKIKMKFALNKIRFCTLFLLFNWSFHFELLHESIERGMCESRPEPSRRQVVANGRDMTTFVQRTYPKAILYLYTVYYLAKKFNYYVNEATVRLFQWEVNKPL